MHNLESGWPKPLPAALCWDQSSDGVKPDLTCSSDGVKPDLTCSRTRKLFEPKLRRSGSHVAKRQVTSASAPRYKCSANTKYSRARCVLC